MVKSSAIEIVSNHGGHLGSYFEGARRRSTLRRLSSVNKVKLAFFMGLVSRPITVAIYELLCLKMWMLRSQ